MFNIHTYINEINVEIKGIDKVVTANTMNTRSGIGKNNVR